MIDKIFGSKEFELPILIYEGDYVEFLERKFDSFKEMINLHNISLSDEDVKLSDAEIKLINNTCSAIIKALRDQYSGYPARAFNKVHEVFKSLSDYFIFMNYNQLSQVYLYRGRKGTNFEFEQSELFHIPFQNRGMVNSYRYSIPGHPTLYLGSSPYVCWNELRKPNFDELHMSGFRLKKSKMEEISILDFGYRPSDIYYFYKMLDVELRYSEIHGYKNDFLASFDNNDNSYKDYFKRYIILWPLIAACSVKVGNDKNIFKAEYIIPQLLLQWIRNDKLHDNNRIDGIRYFSVSTNYKVTNDPYENPIELIQNYVFPSQIQKTTGHCEYLCELFEFTNPIIWSLNDTYLHDEQDTNRQFIDILKLEIHRGVPIDYKTTSFYQIERVINSMQFKSIP